MILFFVGEIHGAISSLYDKIIRTESDLGVEVDWVIQTGNFGVWPDPLYMDRTTRRRSDIVEFPSYYHNSKSIPRQTLFVAGKHEDHRWLNMKRDRGEMQILPNLHWLLNGYKTNIGTNEESISVVGLGKVYSPSTYNNRKLPEKRRLGHYTRSEVERACSQGPTDLLVTHEAPYGVKLNNKVSSAQGISKICYAVRPKLLIHSHCDTSAEYVDSSTGTPVLSLANGEVRAAEYNGQRFSLIV